MMALSTLWKVDSTIGADGNSPVAEQILQRWEQFRSLPAEKRAELHVSECFAVQPELCCHADGDPAYGGVVIAGRSVLALEPLGEPRDLPREPWRVVDLPQCSNDGVHLLTTPFGG